MRTPRFLTSMLVLCVLAATSGFGVTTGEKVKTQGMIISRQNNSLAVKTETHGEILVHITEHTKISMPKGWLRNKKMPASALVPGLWIKVEGIGNNPGQMLAESVSFSGNDLRTAKAIQGGLAPLDARVQANQQQIQETLVKVEAHQQQIQSNQQQIRVNRENIQTTQQGVQRVNQRLSDLSTYEVRSTAFVYFPVGSAELSPLAQNELLQMASNARRLKTYVLQVKAYTDSVGHAASNQDLSMRRAQSVIAFLEQKGAIPLTNILFPAAMGETGAITSNETLEGRAGNRRAEIRILVNRGLLAQE
jgi:OmpA-OmpF porin, OOP family